MFHIKDDKRSQRSAELIVNGVKQCLKRKRFEDITITDIQKASTVGRATFYRLFDRTEDVLEYSCDIGVKRIINELLKSEHPTINEVNEYILEYAAALELVMTSRREHILYNCVYKYENEIRTIMKLAPENTGSVYFTSILTGIAISVVDTWINNGRKETADEVHKCIYDTLKQLIDMYKSS